MKLTILIVLLLLTFSFQAFGQGKSQTAPTPKCTLALAQAPALRGLGLGMTSAQLLARFPGLSLDRADELGVSRLRLTLIDVDLYPKGPSNLDLEINPKDSSNRDSDPNPKSSSNRGRGVQIDIASGKAEGRAFTAESSRFPDLKGVRKIQLRLVDGRIAQVLVGYDNSFKWNGVDEFTETVSKNLKLTGDWQIPLDSDGVGREKELRCEGFLMAAKVGGDTTDARIGAQLSLEDTAMTQTIEKRQKDREEKKRREEAERRKTFKP